MQLSSGQSEVSLEILNVLQPLLEMHYTSCQMQVQSQEFLRRPSTKVRFLDPKVALRRRFGPKTPHKSPIFGPFCDKKWPFWLILGPLCLHVLVQDAWPHFLGLKKKKSFLAKSGHYVAISEHFAVKTPILC